MRFSEKNHRGRFRMKSFHSQVIVFTLKSLISVEFFLFFLRKISQLKSVRFKKPVTRSSFLSKSVVIFNITITNMTTLFENAI